MSIQDLPTPQEMFLQDSQLANNRSMRILLCLCIDCSTSMVLNGAITRINAGILDFLKRVNDYLLARDAADICLVTFGNEAQVLCEFGSAEAALRYLRAHPISANGSETALAAGVQLAVDRIEARRQRLASVNNNSYTPWLIIISDGDSTENDSDVRKASARVKKLIAAGRLKTMCLSMGEGSASLQAFSRDGHVDRLENLSVSKFFDNLSRNLTQASRNAVEYDGMAAPTDWQ